MSTALPHYLCPHCATLYPEAEVSSHLQACTWSCRPTKALGYRYVVAVARSSHTPMVVQHCDNRSKAQREAKGVMGGKLGIYGMVEIRVIRRDGQVTDRWWQTGRVWKSQDVVKAIRAETEKGTLMAKPVKGGDGGGAPAALLLLADLF